MYSTLTQFEEDLHENQREFHRVLDNVVEAEMQMYQDMALLNEIQKKNERTKLLLTHSSQKILVVEESQNYIMKMLSELETDLSQFLSHSGARVGGGQYRGDQDVMPGLRARNSERLFQRLDGLCLEM